MGAAPYTGHPAPGARLASPLPRGPGTYLQTTRHRPLAHTRGGPRSAVATIRRNPALALGTGGRPEGPATDTWGRNVEAGGDRTSRGSARPRQLTTDGGP